MCTIWPLKPKDFQAFFKKVCKDRVIGSVQQILIE